MFNEAAAIQASIDKASKQFSLHAAQISYFEVVFEGNRPGIHAALEVGVEGGTQLIPLGTMNKNMLDRDPKLFDDWRRALEAWQARVHAAATATSGGD